MIEIHRIQPIKRPNGLDDIINTFGDIYSYIVSSDNGQKQIDPKFEKKFITSIELPYPMLPAWNHKKTISVIKCHILLADRFQAVFNEIKRNNLCDQTRYFGGCYVFRNKRNGSNLSAHAWGIAIDINPETNKQGRPGDMALEIMAIFQKYGFIWGGQWSGTNRDPMHFQYCSGY